MRYLTTRIRRLPRFSDLALLTLGLFLFALGIVLTLRSGLGLGPWDVLHQGLSLHLPISLGLSAILVSVLVLAVIVPLRERVGWGTILNSVLIGVFVDLILWTGLLAGANRAPLPARLVVDIVGVATIGVGSALYIKAGLGAGPRDSLMLALSRISGRRVGVVRTGIEVCVLAIGFALGGTVGVGTLVFALGIGPSVDIAFRVFRVRPHRPVPSAAS